MSDPRAAAADVLMRIERERAYSSLSIQSVLRAQSFPTENDNALFTLLVYGVIERKITLDYNLSLYLKAPLKKLHPYVCAVLRLGAYQILFAERIPVHAAINESVKLVKANGLTYAAGLVNAVLRKLSANGLALPEKDDPVRYLSVAYSCPEPLVAHFIRHYGTENTLQHLSSSVGARPLFIRCNALKCTSDMLKASLAAEGGVCTESAPEGCFVLEAPGNITQLSAFRNGWFYVQDRSSQTAALLLDVSSGDTVVDCCAAPGGKSFTVAQKMQNRGVLYACDLYEHKTALIESGAKRLGITNIVTLCEDAAQLWKRGIQADAVLCDVPCSGFGVIGRKPEIRYKDIAGFAQLPETQYAILCSGARMVKPGGNLVYSTCTLNPEENEEVCRRFTEEHPDFTVQPVVAEKTSSAFVYMNVFASPNGGDGFFAAKFKRDAL